MSLYKAEYMWLDGKEPTSEIRSKTRILAEGKEPPLWGFDGSSTNQAPGDNSDCVLKPVYSCPDPIRDGNDILVVCEVVTIDMEPHPTNTRAACAEVAAKVADQDFWFAYEQEYTLFSSPGVPVGWPEDGGYPAPQFPYYCGVGADKIAGRELVEEHLDACLAAGLGVSGINAEVMLGQWEFQLGPLGPLAAGDQLIVARWLLNRLGEDYGISVSLDAKPVKGDWNGAGCHTNFSNKAMRESYDACIGAAEALGERVMLHVENYGHDIEARLTGHHETAHFTNYSYGISDRGASVRIPWQVAKDGKGYIEDRRPNANCDPYVVARLICETVGLKK